MKLKSFLLATALLFSVFTFGQNYKINHIEPAFWWIGMQHSQLQVLVHGDNISELTPSFSYPNLYLDSVVRTSNPNYLFLYLSLNNETEAGSFDIIFSANKEELKFNFELKQREENSAQRIGFNSTDAMYLITPDRFANAIPENDEVDNLFERKNRNEPFGRHGGDLQGIIDHLDYIEDMGFTAIWLNPVVENNHKRSSYHGYSTTDYYKIDERFGSNEDYARLSDEASKRGIKLIMDQIMNHCGSEHWWTEDMPSEDWYHYANEVNITNHRRTTLHDPYASNEDRELFENGWFVQSMPDLNQSNQLLADYLIQNSIWWVEYANLGGIRHDTHPYASKDFMDKYACRIMQEYPNFNIVGEEWSPNPVVIAKWLKNNPFPNNQSCLPSLMDFPLHITLLDALRDEESWDKGFINMYEMLSNDFMYSNPSNLVVFPDNHDIQRFYTLINEDFDLFKTAMIYVASINRIPQIFYGTEYLAVSPGEKHDGRIRSDFPGGWAGDTINAFTGVGLTKQKSEAQNFTRKLFNWRKENAVIHSGNLKHFAPENGVYVFFRYNKEKTVMVILNKNEGNVTLNTDRFKEVISTYTTGKDVITDGKYDLNQLELKARTSLLLELSK